MPLVPTCASEKLHGKLTSKVPVAVKQKLLELVGKDEKSYHRTPPTFCEACVKNVKELFPELNIGAPHQTQAEAEAGSSSTQPDDDSDEPEDKVPRLDRHDREDIDVEGLTDEGRAFDLGRAEAARLRTYAVAKSSDKNFDSLLGQPHYDKAADCTTLQAFLSGLSHHHSSQQRLKDPETHQTKTQKAQKLYQMYKSVESVLNLSAVNLTLPVHFRESVLLYTLTGSKLALTILGSAGAHASYKSVKFWLGSLASQTPEIPEGDLIVAFDNQVLQRRWKVMLRNEVKCSIVTVVASFTLSKEGRLQHQAELKPMEWASRALSEGEIAKIKYIDQTPEIKATHYEHLHRFLSEEINEVVKEHTEQGPVEG